MVIPLPLAILTSNVTLATNRLSDRLQVEAGAETLDEEALTVTLPTLPDSNRYLPLPMAFHELYAPVVNAFNLSSVSTADTLAKRLPLPVLAMPYTV